MNIHFQSKKILIAPLDWGLGHATRCMPLIHYFRLLKCDVTIAASGNQKRLLQTEFPDLQFIELPGYNITYSKKKRWMPIKILIQIPKILKIIRLERSWLKSLLAKKRFDAVISDNRYGLVSKNVISIFITHQLQIITSLKPAKILLRKLSYSYINHFSECWVPDFEGAFNIAGSLSHPTVFPKVPVKYLGPVSRFSKTDQQQSRYKFIVIISGPEPQRTLFEEKIFKYAQSSAENFLIIRGMPQHQTTFPRLQNCTVHDHLPAKDMSVAISSTEFIISRCGYTTIMEILSLQKKSILIPTPGQTEQEYLAKHLREQHWCYTFNQHEDFYAHIKNAKQFNYYLPEINTEAYKIVLENFISSLQ